MVRREVLPDDLCVTVDDQFVSSVTYMELWYLDGTLYGTVAHGEPVKETSGRVRLYTSEPIPRTELIP